VDENENVPAEPSVQEQPSNVPTSESVVDSAPVSDSSPKKSVPKWLYLVAAVVVVGVLFFVLSM
jgi:hypothetical protein